ncbi:MAG TPA: PqqD family peptide modification chaperone [Lachnospiraceae bacterium]|nr:PqqD family peptide modification chaperone [Lachnospiraceae bacterium]
MDKNASIKLNKKLNVTDLAGEKVMIDFETGKYFLIKGTGNDIWDMLQENITPAQVIEKLLQEYDVTPEECEAAVIDFLDKMKSYDFID